MNRNAIKVGIVATATLAAGWLAGCESNSKQASAPKPTANAQQPAQKPTPAAEGASNANADRYDLRSPKEPISVGKKAKVNLTVAAADGLKINQEFPWSIEFGDAQGVQLAQKSFSKEQLELGHDTATIPVLLEASAAGKHTLRATGNFSVCNDAQCYVIRNQSLAFNVEATETDGGAEAGADKKPAE